MSKPKLFGLLATITLIVGFTFHIMYTDGALVLSNNGDTAATIYSSVLVPIMLLFVLFTYLAFSSKYKSITTALLCTVLISGAVLVAGYISILVIGLSAI